MTHAPRWSREDKLRLIACSAAVALMYGILSAALFFGSHEFLRQYAVGLLIVALALLPVVGMVAGYVVRAAKPWREAFAIAGIVTLAVLLVVLGMEASLNTCGAAGSSSCDTAACGNSCRRLGREGPRTSGCVATAVTVASHGPFPPSDS